ncbi:MAG TPA: putative zinc-binding protein [Acidobacteriota bacterium]|nr:putative zinc-binding protein [Acidobacteriota bacterium]
MKRKALIVPCSGIGKTYGTVAREGAHIVTEDLCPRTSKLVPLAHIVLEDREVKETLAKSPAIAIDGCKLSCAAKVIAESGGTVAHALQVLDVYRRHRELKPTGIATLNNAGQKLAEMLAKEVSSLVDAIEMENSNV